MTGLGNGIPMGTAVSKTMKHCILEKKKLVCQHSLACEFAIISMFSIFFSEILRVIDSLQLTAVKQVATPADWKVSFFAEIIL